MPAQEILSEGYGDAATWECVTVKPGEPWPALLRRRWLRQGWRRRLPLLRQGSVLHGVPALLQRRVDMRREHVQAARALM